MLDAWSRDKLLSQAPRQQSNEEAQCVHDLMHEFSQMTTWRNMYAGQCEESAALIDPVSRNTFFYGSYTWPGMKLTDWQVDATGMLALSRFAAICDSLLTPRNSKWHALEADDSYVMKDRETRLWFEQVTNILFKLRYDPLANYAGQNYASWRSLGAYGNATMFIDALDGRQHGGARGFRYKAVPFGETFFGENHQGQVDRIFRWFRMTAYQAAQRFGIERLPLNLHKGLYEGSQWPYQFLHVVKPRKDYDSQRLDAKALPWASYYLSIEGLCLMAPEGGYRQFPYAVSRYEQAPNEVYGRGPAQMVLPALKTLNAEKATFLKQGHRIVDPVLFTADDGIIDTSLRPGSINKGGVTQDGKLLVHVLPTGEIQISKEMMQEERGLINDAFLVTLFQILTETPQMTATEVVERTNEKGILLAPTMGRQQSEKLGPQIDREIDIASSQRLLPPMPPRLREAQGEYQVVYTSPLARAAKAQEAAGFMRTVESVKELVNITGDMSLLDPFNFDEAVPAIAAIQAVPESWMADKRMITAKRQARAKQQAQKAQVDALPAQAAMMKAQAVVAKNQPGIAPGQAFGGPNRQPQGTPA